ncbi:hypothetical protein N0V94_001021 [Neodidymelliopsis sp. IMI 364377]|nr:hypothetical protein N0V94_001021 [Neodidymelliopsis sp. IMI 364377]
MEFMARTDGELIVALLGDIVPLSPREPEFDVRKMDWDPIRALLIRQWFHRLWVVQEVCHARRAIAMCGSEVISWSTLAAALTYLVENDLTKYLGPLCAYACNSVASIEYMRARTVKDALFAVVLDNAYGGCTDPRDKIFAMMSIAAGRDEFDWEISLDYTLSPDELYKRFAIWDIVRNKSLRSLSCATSAPSHDDAPLPQTPTWVPDWTRILNRHLLARTAKISNFSAGSGRPTNVWFSNDKSLLHAEGSVIDSIYILGSEPPELKATSLFEIDAMAIGRFVKMKEWLLACWDIARADRPMTPAAYDALWRTLLCDMDSTGHQAPTLYSKYFFAYFRFMRQAPEILETTLQDAAPLAPLEPTLSRKATKLAVFLGLVSHAAARDASNFHDWFDSHLHTNTLVEESMQKWGASKSLCRTRHGRLARVPNHATTHDLICILHGAEVPYVLRLQEDGTYVVIGECYVHGVMHGEALQSPTYESHMLRIR